MKDFSIKPQYGFWEDLLCHESKFLASRASD